MKKEVFIVVIVLILALAGVFIYNLSTDSEGDIPQEDNNGEEIVEDYSDLIVVSAPAPNSVIESPLTVAGQARGYWFFEANFPIFLETPNGERIGGHYVEAIGEWMTEDFVPFRGTLEFDTDYVGPATLIFAKSNASGLPEHDDEYSIPVYVGGEGN